MACKCLQESRYVEALQDAGLRPTEMQNVECDCWQDHGRDKRREELRYVLARIESELLRFTGLVLTFPDDTTPPVRGAWTLLAELMAKNLDDPRGPSLVYVNLDRWIGGDITTIIHEAVGKACTPIGFPGTVEARFLPGVGS